MNKHSELLVYLECEKNKLIEEFPKYKCVTISLYQKLIDFLDTDFEGMTDNHIYRSFLTSFKEMIIFAFEEDVSKAYLRYFFKSLNHEIFVGYLANRAKSRTKDIRSIMARFLDYFTATWQGCNHDKKRVLEGIIYWIDYWM